MHPRQSAVTNVYVACLQKVITPRYVATDLGALVRDVANRSRNDMKAGVSFVVAMSKQLPNRDMLLDQMHVRLVCCAGWRVAVVHSHEFCAIVADVDERDPQRVRQSQPRHHRTACHNIHCKCAAIHARDTRGCPQWPVEWVTIRTTVGPVRGVVHWYVPAGATVFAPLVTPRVFVLLADGAGSGMSDESKSEMATANGVVASLPQSFLDTVESVRFPSPIIDPNFAITHECVAVCLYPCLLFPLTLALLFVCAWCITV